MQNMRSASCSGRLGAPGLTTNALPVYARSASPRHCSGLIYCHGVLASLTRPSQRPHTALGRLQQCQAVATSAVAAPTSPATEQIPRGETAGAMLVLEDVTIQAGDRDLLDSVSWRMMPGHRVGLVGANGAGKSTLLKCLCGLRRVDAGRLLVSSAASVGYLAQTAVSGSTRTVFQEVRAGMTHLVAAEAALEAAANAAAAGDPAAGDALMAAQDAFEAAGGYTSDRTIANVLGGLGFEEHQWSQSCAEFSGGWQMRIALARLLLSPAGQAATSASSSAAAGGGLLLLDEPTNHLDTAAVNWLAGFLSNSGGSLVLVSHDEQLLQGACDRMIEVRGRKLHQYVGNYSKFLQLREERAVQAAATAAAQAAEIARLEAFIARFGAKAAKASEAQSKLKLLEKLKAEQVEIPAAASGSGPGDARKVALQLPKAPPCYTDVITLTDISVGWGEPTPEATPVLQGVNLGVRKGQRVLVLGPNGAGKSTLLKVIAGRLAAWSGQRQLGEGVRLAVFDQDLAQELPGDEVALDYVSARAREHDVSITLERCRQALGSLGLTGSLALQTIGSLSGGEKARVALAVFALVPANVLLLDEASNHLDAATLEVLTEALQGFEGAIVAITHNPAFAAALHPTHLLRVQGGSAKLAEYAGGLTAADFQHTPAPSSSSTSSGTAKAGGSKGSKKGAAAATTKQGRGAKASGAKASGAKAPGASSSTSSSSSSSSNSGSSSSSSSSSGKPSRKRTTLAYSEQTEYKGLSKQMEQLGAQRTQLEQQLAAAATKVGGGVGAARELEEASQKLAAVVAALEEKELRWLELAELAGDL